jgi:hypothetical protein
MGRRQPERVAELQARFPLGSRVRLNAEHRAVWPRSAHKTWRVVGYTVDGVSLRIASESGEPCAKAACASFFEAVPQEGADQALTVKQSDC